MTTDRDALRYAEDAEAQTNVAAAILKDEIRELLQVAIQEAIIEAMPSQEEILTAINNGTWRSFPLEERILEAVRRGAEGGR